MHVCLWMHTICSLQVSVWTYVASVHVWMSSHAGLGLANSGVHGLWALVINQSTGQSDILIWRSYVKTLGINKVRSPKYFTQKQNVNVMVVLHERWVDHKLLEFILALNTFGKFHNFMAIHPIMFEILQSGPKWWADWLADRHPSIYCYFSIKKGCPSKPYYFNWGNFRK